MPLSSDLFDYELPPRLIAQTPAARRDQSRLLVVHRNGHRLEHRVFSDLPEYLRKGDILIRNNASVLPARLQARRPTGGAVECFLLRPVEGETTWRCLLKPGRRLPSGAVFEDPEGRFSGKVAHKEADGSAIVRFTTPGGESITAIANRIGNVPLPPYIVRNASEPTDEIRALDRERYQTVYAERAHQVAVAAPTAGLHFTPELLAVLSDAGVSTADLTLHVGLGTFKPITAATVEEHAIHREIYEIPPATQQVLLKPRDVRRIAVGTTSVRTVEDFLRKHETPLQNGGPCVDETDLFIHPPRAFRGIEALITNFHQPRSTLLCLVAAFLSPGQFGGIDWIREIYAEAIRREYRFLSYGDAMLII